MTRIAAAALTLAVLAGSMDGQERDGLRNLERARQHAIHADSLLRGYVQFLGLRRAFLGVNVNTRSSDTDSIGALIHSVSPNGPAAKAGIRSGDIITKLDGQSLLAAPTEAVAGNASLPGLRLIELVARLEPNDTVVVELRRGDLARQVNLVTEPPPYFVRSWRTPDGRRGYAIGTDSFTFELDTANMGAARRRLDALRNFREGLPRVPLLPPLVDLELSALNPDLGAYFGAADGVLVISAPATSTLNLKGGDVVLAVDGRKPNSPGHLLRILRTYDVDERVRFAIMRNKRRITVTGTVQRWPR